MSKRVKQNKKYAPDLSVQVDVRLGDGSIITIPAAWLEGHFDPALITKRRVKACFGNAPAEPVKPPRRKLPRGSAEYNVMISRRVVLAWETRRAKAQAKAQ